MQLAHLLLVVPALTASLAFAKKSSDFETPKGNELKRAIAVYKSDVTDAHIEKVSRRQGKVLRQMRNARTVAFELNAGSLDELMKDNDVEYIAPDRPLKGHSLGEAEDAVRLWKVSTWYSQNGNCRGCLRGPVGVAVLDSGIQASHKDMAWWNSTTSRVVYSESFVDTTAGDTQGHGTHVAGIIGAEGNISCLQGGLDANGNCRASQAFFGLAAGVQFINLKVLDANGQGTDSGVIAAIDRAIQLKSAYNIRVLNLSLGRPVRESYKTDPLCRAVARAWDAGIVVVVAAGNEGRNNTANTNGYGTISSPGNEPKVITVGAVNTQANWTDSDDRAATYSSKGPTIIDQIVKPDLVAPGNAIVSLQAASSNLAKQYPGNRPPISSYWPWITTGASPYYFKLSGTSMAAPMVSGAAALLIDKDPTLTPNMVKARLMKTARRGMPKTVSVYDTATAKWYTVTHDIFTVGAGMLDVGAAFFNTERPSGSAASPKAVYNSTTKKVSLNFAATGGTNVVWGDSAGYFSTNVVWGDNVIWGTNVVWGDNVIWGTVGTGGFNVVWGDSSPFGTGSSATQALGILINGE